MKVAGRFLIAIAMMLLMVLSSSCSSSRLLNYPYAKVADLAKKEFGRNEWTKTSTMKSEVTEKDGSLEIECYDWEFPDTKIYCEVEVIDNGSKGTKLYVFVRDCSSWWYPFNFNPSLATAVLDSFEGSLGWKGFFRKFEKPWRRKK